MSTITGIRAAILSDVESIADIHVTCWREVYDFMPAEVHQLRDRDYRLRQWETWFKTPPPGEAIFVLESGDRVVGFAVAKPNEDPAIDCRGDFHACYILPEFRGGVSGPLSMMALALFLKDNGLWPACVWAFKHNKYKRIYPAIGCKVMVFRDRVIGGHALPEIGYLAPEYDTLMARLHRMYVSGARHQTGSPQMPRPLSALTG